MDDIYEWNDYKNILNTLEHTPLSEIENTKDNKETLLIGIIKAIQTRSAKIKGVFIEEHFAIVNLVDPHGSVELMLNSEKLKQLQKMNLDELVVFKVKITDSDSSKSIDVSDIMTIDEAKELSK
jgi:hypothetical protein